MDYDDFPDEASLRFRAHVLYAYAQSTLALAAELAENGHDTLTEADLKLFDELAAQTERIFVEAVKLKNRVRG